MLVRIVSDRWLYIDQVSVPEEEIIDKHFTAYPKNVRYVDLSRQHWDGSIRKYDRANKRLNRSLLAELRALCAQRKLPITVVDERPPPKYPAPDPSTITSNFLPGITLDDCQVEAIRTACRIEVGLFDLPTGGGKCFGRGTMVRMYDGSVKAVEDVIAGDLVMGDDSTPRLVLGTTNGVAPLYKINQKNGDPYIVNGDHVLVTKCTRAFGGGPKGRIVELTVDDYRGRSKTGRHMLKGYKVGVSYPERPVDIDPYVLGLWLGDGIARDARIEVRDDDIEIKQYLQKYAQSIGCVLVPEISKEDKKCCEYAIRLYQEINAPSGYEPFTENPFKAGLRRYGLISNKHIPIDYSINSREVRAAVLAGFIDSDGTACRRLSADITHKPGRLIDGIADLARSLGFRVSISPCKKACTTTGVVDDYVRLKIVGDLSILPTILPRKSFVKPTRDYDHLVTGIECEPIGSGQYYGFQVDGNGRFLLADYTVTHNSELIAGVCKAMNCPTAIIAEQTIVVEQLKRRLELRNVVEEVGVFCAGQTPAGHRVIVGTIQSLCIPSKFPDQPERKSSDTDAVWAKKLARFEAAQRGLQTRKKRALALRKLIGECDLLLVDEADRATSKQYRKLFLNWFKGRRKYGFSGTVFDVKKPVEKLILQEHLGSIIFQETRENLVAKGRILPLDFYVIAIGDQRNKTDKAAFDIATMECMVENEEFHQIIAALCEGFPADEGTLILVERDQLGYNLEKAIPNSKFVHGKTPKKTRREILGQYERREFNVLIGGKILKRGLDLDGGCENLIIASGGQLQSEFIQQIGRAVRRNKKGRSRVYDFLFYDNYYLYSHSRSRLKIMVSLGYPVKVIYKDTIVDGQKLVNSRFRVPKSPKK